MVALLVRCREVFSGVEAEDVELLFTRLDDLIPADANQGRLLDGVKMLGDGVDVVVYSGSKRA